MEALQMVPCNRRRPSGEPGWNLHLCWNLHAFTSKSYYWQLFQKAVFGNVLWFNKGQAFLYSVCLKIIFTFSNRYHVHVSCMLVLVPLTLAEQNFTIFGSKLGPFGFSLKTTLRFTWNKFSEGPDFAFIVCTKLQTQFHKPHYLKC